MSLNLRAVTSALLIALAACGGDGGGPEEPKPTIAKTATNSGDGQIADVTEELPEDLRVVVTLNGDPVEGADVTWSASANSGAVLPATATTGLDGIAVGTWTLGTKSGTVTASASLSGATGSPVQFAATAEPDVPNSFAIQGGDDQSGDVGTPFGDPLTVRLGDQFGNAVPGEVVSWSVTSGSANLSGLTSNTNANGIAAINATFGATAGAIVIQAVPPNALPAVEFHATANPLPTAITINVMNNFFSPGVDTVAVGGTVTWNWVGTGHNVTSDPASGPLDSGTHNSPFTYGPIAFDVAGTYHYECTNHQPGMDGIIVVR